MFRICCVLLIQNNSKKDLKHNIWTINREKYILNVVGIKVHPTRTIACGDPSIKSVSVEITLDHNTPYNFRI